MSVMQRINPFFDIYKQCNGLTNLEKYKLLGSNKKLTPIYLDVELTNCCNIRCNMCPVGAGVMQRKKGFMNDDVFYRIVEDIKRYHIQGVRFIRWGEPMLHPQFLEWGGVFEAGRCIGAF